LVGTVSIEKSEVLADLLRKKSKIMPQVLNAKYHEREAYIIAQAGVPGAVTIATNMAGRGTDIQLGGNADYRIAEEEARIRRPLSDAEKDEIRRDVAEKKKVALDAGGLYVIGTERHESRRIDNQLRGRSGRQGDPGASKFYLSLQDDLMRIFGSERMDGMLQKLGLEPGEAIIHPWINKAIEKAQKKVEARNFDIRKNLLQFDDVMNDQRRAIFDQRREVMLAEDIQQLVADMRHEVIADIVARCIPERAMPVEWDIAALHEETLRVLGLDLPFKQWAEEEGIADEEIRERVIKEADSLYAHKRKTYGPEVMGQVEKAILLQTLDHLWREHIVTIEHLRQVIHLRGYGQRDPLNEFKFEGFTLFEAMVSRFREMTTSTLMRAEVRQHEADDMLPDEDDLPPMLAHHFDATTGLDDVGEGLPLLGAEPPRKKRKVDPKDPSTWGNPGRNETCPCGSGKKFKHCHGAFV
jgi:preprotein translocase subunit SecA